MANPIANIRAVNNKATALMEYWQFSQILISQFVKKKLSNAFSNYVTCVFLSTFKGRRQIITSRDPSADWELHTDRGMDIFLHLYKLSLTVIFQDYVILDFITLVHTVQRHMSNYFEFGNMIGKLLQNVDLSMYLFKKFRLRFIRDLIHLCFIFLLSKFCF